MDNQSAREIDCSKAPDGWRLVPIIPTPEMRSAAGAAECMAVRERRQFFAGDSWRPMVMSAPAYRAPQWTGEGLPPVGTVCEVVPHNSQWGFDTIEPRRCTILAHHADFVWLDTGVPGTPISTRTDKVDFNVIRAPEQIAAEDREKAIDVMVAESPLLDKGWSRLVCAGLYDAGYRKAEGGAK